jgi:hypothetical protein
MRLLGGIAERVAAAIVAELPIEKKRFFEVSKTRNPSRNKTCREKKVALCNIF